MSADSRQMQGKRQCGLTVHAARSFRGPSAAREPGTHEHGRIILCTGDRALLQAPVFMGSGLAAEPVLGPRGARTRGRPPQDEDIS